MTTESYSYDDIQSGSDEIATTSVTIAAGQDLVAFEPLGQVTATGKFIRSLPGASDGSQKPVYVTPQPIDATSGDKQSQVIKSGTLDPEMVVFDASYSAVNKLTAFVGTPISLQKRAAQL